MNAKPIYKSPAGEQAVMALYESALARWPAPYDALTVPTRHGDTFVIACGDLTAPPLVLLHGAGTNSAIWAGDIGDYSRRFRVYAADLPGEPGRSAPNRPAWDSPAYADWLEDVFGALKIDRAALIGISQGGWTALKFATRQPERVRQLVLICPGGVIPDRLSFVLRAIAYSLLGRRGVKGIVRLTFGDQVVPDGVEEIMAVIMRHFKPRMGILPRFTDDDLRCLTMPTLLIGGGQDALRNNERIAARLRALLPNLGVIIIPAAGHAVLNTREPILAFLSV